MIITSARRALSRAEGALVSSRAGAIKTARAPPVWNREANHRLSLVLLNHKHEAKMTTMTAPPIGERAKRIIAEYPFTQVKEKIVMEETIRRAVLDDAIEEFRKFLILLGQGYRGLGMISRDVDEVWHTFILFTKDYAAFCTEVFGEFMHHQPGLASSPLGTEPRRRFLEAYTATFGCVPDIWGENTQCFSTCDTPSTNCQDPSCK